MTDHYLIYVRQSYRRKGENADADVSPEAQEKAARAALPSGATAEVIADSGGHRSGRTDDRDGYRQLIGRLTDADVSGVAVYDLSRLARNARLMLNLKHELDRRNLHLVVSNLPGSSFDDAVGKFLFGQLCQAAQFQADLDSERMIGITKTKHERGGHNGSDPFGYRAARDGAGRIVQPHHLEVLPDEAEVVRLIFDRYGAGGISQGQLAQDLRAEGRQRRGRPWVEKSVQDVLRRAEFYLGNVVYRRGADVRQGEHDPIISLEQAHLAKRASVRRQRPGRYGSRGRTYLLARVAYCVCGLRLRSETRVSRGKGWAYYVCPGRRDGRCDQSAIRVATADAVVIEHLASQATPTEVVDLMREELRTMRHVPDEGLRAQRQRIETAMKRLGDRYTWQEIEEAEYREERRKLEARLAELPLPADSNIIAFDRAATLLPFASIIRETTPEHQQEIIRHIVERVVIEDREVVGVTVRPEARPFFGDYPAAVVMAPPDGSRGAQPTFSVDGVDVLVMELLAA